MSSVDPEKATEIARRLGVDLLWEGEGVPDGFSAESWAACIAAAGLYARGVPITKIAEQVGFTRQSIHRWIKDHPDAWSRAIEMNKTETMRTLVSKATIGLEKSLESENESVVAATSKWVLARTDTRFLDPKYKTFSDPETGQVGLAELGDVSSEDLRALLNFVRKGGDLKQMAAMLQDCDENTIDITKEVEERTSEELGDEPAEATEERDGRALADKFFNS